VDNDDRPVGRVLNRKEFLALMTAMGGAYLAACSGLEGDSSPGPGESPSPEPTTGPETEPALVATLPETGAVPNCIARPEMTEGPFFLDEQLNRSDIRAEPSDGSIKEGIPLTLTYHVLQAGEEGCRPLAGAVVDVWHCDAQGNYSGVGGLFDGPEAQGTAFLRGYQVTDGSGMAQFLTIYPGWYRGRTVHIHFKIRGEAPEQRAYEFTSQLFFSEEVNDQVLSQEPYAGTSGRETRNSDDFLFRSVGEDLLVEPIPENGGYRAEFNIALDLS
jgi:protocatechuate 3,4-dioxygenase beta subunit